MQLLNPALIVLSAVAAVSTDTEEKVDLSSKYHYGGPRRYWPGNYGPYGHWHGGYGGYRRWPGYYGPRHHYGPW